MKLLRNIFIFLVINFGALYIGNLLMDNGPQTDWYINLNKAPWTPPGWVFGAAWTTIMICFSIYMAHLVNVLFNTKVVTLFSVQFILNVIWNYVFFNQHLISIGLLIILMLTAIVSIMLYDFRQELKAKSILILPYFIWLCIATSLNMYILIHN